MSPEHAKMVVACSIGVLAAVFVSAFVILVVICRQQRPNKGFVVASLHKDVELCQLQGSFEDITQDLQWIDETGLIPQCLSILRTCRLLTEHLTALAMSPSPILRRNFTQIIEKARAISSRVDDLVQGMNPPLDARLLEARAAALTLSVSHLALIAKYEFGPNCNKNNWIGKSLDELDQHLKVLRQAALVQDTNPM